MGGQNPNANGRNPSGNPENKDTSVTSRAPGNSINPVSAPPNINGGQGKVGGPYGVQITTDKRNAYGESQTREGGGQGKVGGPYGVILSGSQSNDYNAKANEYAKSLVNNAGLAQGSDQYNTAFSNYLSANKLEQVKDSNSPINRDDTAKSLSFSENYGYTSKVSPIVSQNFDKNPLESNYDLVKDKAAIQARNSFKSMFSSDQGGVQTKQSEDKSFGYSWAGKQSESIGAKIFSNQESFSRGSDQENQAKQTAAEKAFSSTPSTSNKDYATGGTKDVDSVVTLGKAQQVFGKDKTSFGWSGVSKDQLVRDSIQEKALNTTLGARSTFQEGIGTPFSGGLTDKAQTRNASDVFFSSQSPKSQSSVLVSKPQEQTQDFNAFFSGAESRGSIINIYNAQGTKVGSVKANEQGRQTLESLGDNQGVYFRESNGNAKYDSSQRRGFADFVSKEGSKGTIIDIFSGDQKVGQVSGPNAYRDTVGLQTKYGSISGKVDYSTTPEGKSLLDVVSKGGIVSFSTPDKGSIGLIYSGDKNAKTTLNDIVSKAPNGFNYQILYPEREKALLNSIQNNPAYFEKQPQSFWDNEYRSGSLQPNDSAQINSIFHLYDREQNKDVMLQNQKNAKNISAITQRNDPSYNFNFKDENGKIVGTATGGRSYYDFLKSQGYGNKSETVGPYSYRGLDVHFSNTFEAASKREDKLTNNLNQGIEAYGSDVKPTQPQLGGLQAIPRLLEQTTGQYVGGIESAFAHLYEKNKSGETQYPGLHGVPETAKNILTNETSSHEFAADIFHTFIPISLSSLAKSPSVTNPTIRASGVSLTPEASTLTNKTSAPSVMAYLMGKEQASPYASKEFYDVQSAFLIGSTVAGLRGAVPITRAANTVLLQKESLTFQGIGKPIIQEKPIAAYKGYAVGYDWLGYRDIYGKTPSGRVFGKPTNEQMAPSGYRVVALEQEGSEIANKGNAYSIQKSTNPDFIDYLGKTGRTVQPNAGEIMNAIIEKNKVTNQIGQTEAVRPFQAGVTADKTVGNALITGIVERQGTLAKIDQGKGGQIGEVYGSGLTFSGGSHAAVETLKEFGFEQKDIESSIHPFLGLGKQKKGNRLTSTIYDKILQAQGFVFNSETKSYEQPRGPENLPLPQQEEYARGQIGDMKYDIASSASKRGLYVGGSTALQLQAGKKGFRPVADVDLYFPVSKFSFIDNLKIGKEAKLQSEIVKQYYSKTGKNPNDVLVTIIDKDPLGTGRKFVKITDKNAGKSIVEIVPRAKPTKGIIKEDKVITFTNIKTRKANQIIRDKVIIIKSLEKKQAAGKRLNANQQAKLEKARKDVESFRNAEKTSTSEMVNQGLLQDYLRTRKEDTKIYSYGKSISGKDVAEGGKIFEIPQLDKDAMGSSGTKGENFFGFKIDKSVHKYPSIIGKKIKGASQVFNKSSQEKKQATLNTKESLSQQGGVTQYHTNIIGNKVFLGEAIYSGGKALARGSVLELDDAMRLISNPATREQGVAHLKNIDIVGKGQSFLYGIDWNKFKNTYFEKRGESVPDVIKSDNSYYQYVNQITGGQPISNFKPSVISKDVSGGGPSSYPGKSTGSNLLSKSATLGIINTSLQSSKSSKSGRSTFSSFSGVSSKSSKSQYSVFSNKSDISGKSSISVISGKSSPSAKYSKSGFSSNSDISNQSSKSSKSGRSTFSSFSGVSGPSGLSGLSGPSGPSGPSGKSGISAFSGTSGTSGYSGFNTVSNPPHLPPFIKIGNIGRRRQGKTKSGPTGLIQLDVHNIFASSLDIEVPKNRRVLF